MKELKATDKVTQKMTHDGAVTENLAMGEVTNISGREAQTDLSATDKDTGAVLNLADRAARAHISHTDKSRAKADREAVKQGSAARRRPSSRLQFTEEERADPTMEKYIRRSDKAADRLDRAKVAIPTKKVLRRERTFDEAAGKGKTRLHFEEVEKKPNGKLHHNPLSRPVAELRASAHGKIRQVENENVGVEAGHKGEVLAERGVSYTGSRIKAASRHRKTKPWRDAAKAEKESIKANAEYLYQKALHDDPGLAASNPVSRFMQKQRIKRNYAKQVRNTGKNTKKAASSAKSAAKKAKEIAEKTAAFVKSNWKVVLIVIAAAAIILLLFGGISSCSMMFGSGSGSVVTSSYLSEDADMYAAENAYLAMEASTRYILDNLSAYYPGYDEYRLYADTLYHDPYILISILSAMHEGAFTSDDVQDELGILFEKQYALSASAVTETRYRTETRIGSYEVENEETGEVSTVYYEYEVQVPYSYTILTVVLDNHGLDTLPQQVLTDEQLELFATYMSTLGNRENLFPNSEYNK